MTQGDTPTRQLAFLALILLLAPAVPAAEVPSDADQIAAAVLAAPEGRRDGAAVIGWRDGKPVQLREGSNDLVCLYDDPADERWSVACYHKDLEPYMARGRQLALEGVTGPERQKVRFAEVEAGDIPIPNEPRTLYVLHGNGYDAGTGEVDGAYLRWVIYVPYATAESTGLSTRPGESVPWLMDPGTPGAHIMINPPRPE
ncbi:MAG: hypothetical protein R3190_05245 [Thermoanaerobaculia bacterium]|nr:hypothetical protein [Thermoanaerobaculia bacterium]